MTCWQRPDCQTRTRSASPGAMIAPPPHAHDYLSASHDAHARATLWVVALTAAMMVVEIIAGFVTGSMALLADGFHMATHAGALGIAAAAYAYARRHAANPRYSFGTGKVGDLAGFASALLLGVVALGIAGESLLRLVEPERVAFSEALIVALAGLAVNLASAWVLARAGHNSHNHEHGGAPHQHLDHHHDNNFRSAYTHVLADALTSLLAIAALLAGRYLGWAWMDPAMGLVGAVVIARWSWGLMRDTADVLLDRSEEGLAAIIRSRIEATGDATISDLHVWRVGPGAYAAIVSLATEADRAAVAERLAGLNSIRHLTIECCRPATKPG